MRDAMVMWRNPRLVVLAAVCAAVYAAAMVPFKVLVIFPGLAEVRPAAALPVVFSFLFGPAGAWGAGLGNVVGDVLGGMFGPGSIFGFLANFAYGYIPYKLWEALMGSREVTAELTAWQGRVPGWMRRPRAVALALAGALVAAVVVIVALRFAGVVDVSKLVTWKWAGREAALGMAAATGLFALIAVIGLSSLVLLFYSPIRLMAVVFVACMACAGILGWGIEWLGFFPFRVFGTWIFANNFILCALLAPPLLILLHPRVAARYMLYTDLLEAPPTTAPQPADAVDERAAMIEAPAPDGAPRAKITPHAARRTAGAAIVIAATLALFFAGVLISPDQFAALTGSSSALVKGLAFTPMVAVLFMGLALL
ncbi:MAG TPA: QueT transporter family protein [bacterium]|nr:QueT transporter family protein [bacterium]